MNKISILARILTTLFKSPPTQKAVIASENLYRIELMGIFSEFLRIIFYKVPFNKRRCFESLENLNCIDFASLFISNLLRIF